MSIVSNRNTPFRSLVFAELHVIATIGRRYSEQQQHYDEGKILITMLLLALLPTACVNNIAST